MAISTNAIEGVEKAVEYEHVKNQDDFKAVGVRQPCSHIFPRSTIGGVVSLFVRVLQMALRYFLEDEDR